MSGRLIAIVGPTASGKTALALEIARRVTSQRFEAVNADSRQVYRFMDIGTAKPSQQEQGALPHHLVDIVYPDEPFSLATWLDMANEALESAWGRGAIPILVGGTGQYAWALLEGWRVPKVPPQEGLRRELEGRPSAELLEQLRAVDPEAHAVIQPGNVRRIVRALEVHAATGKPFSYWRTREPPAFKWIATGIAIERPELYRRIDARVDVMFAAGFVDEVRALRDRGYSCGLPSTSSIGYGEICRHLDGEIDLAEAIRSTKTATHRFARHQSAWFKQSDPRIAWAVDPNQAVTIARRFLEADD